MSQKKNRRVASFQVNFDREDPVHQALESTGSPARQRSNGSDEAWTMNPKLVIHFQAGNPGHA